MQKSKHSKFKNTGILFELLTRQLTADILAGKLESRAKDILFKYFKEHTELGKEWQLYNFLATEQFLDDSKAERALSVVLKTREKLNDRILNEEKYELVKEIKDAYPIEQLLKSTIRNYKVFASVYKVFESHIGKTKFTLREVIQSREYLVENLVKLKNKGDDKEDVLMVEYGKQSEDVRLLAYKFLIENLNTKYKSLNPGQKSILREYINNVSNTNSMSEFITRERDKIKLELVPLVDTVDSDVMKIKLTEVVHQLSNMSFTRGVKDNHVMVLLLAHELVKEISNVTKKP